MDRKVSAEFFLLVEKNIRQVCLLDLTADSGVKTNAKVDYQLRERERA